jgi:hypothetical protein
LLLDDVWIHIGATFLPNLESAGPLINAAITEVRS